MRRVALLSTGAVGEAAWRRLTLLSDVAPVRATYEDYALPGVDVLWVHTQDEPPPLPAELLMPCVERGGRLLLTQRAAARVVGLGLEADGPNEQRLPVSLNVYCPATRTGMLLDPRIGLPN